MHSKYIKKTFDWAADFRLWGTAPSCLSHQSLNLVNWILTFSINNFCWFFGPWTQLTPWIHLYEMHTTDDFFLFEAGTCPKRGCWGLPETRVNGSAWPSFDQTDSCNWKSLPWNKLGMSSPLQWIFVRKSKVDGIRVTQKLHLITRNRWEHWKPHHLLGWCLGRGKWSNISLTHAFVKESDFELINLSWGHFLTSTYEAWNFFWPAAFKCCKHLKLPTSWGFSSLCEELSS